MAKGIKIAGVGADNLRVIDVDRDFAMRPDDLARQIDADLAAGLTPFFVCAHRRHHVVPGHGSAARDR